MEAHSASGPQYLYDQVKQQLRLQTERPTALREAIYHCRKGGTVFALGVFAAVSDKATHVLPLSAGPRGYELFKDEKVGSVRSVFRPGE